MNKSLIQGSILILRWITRLIGAGLVGLLLLFLIGEGDFDQMRNLGSPEKIKLLLVPLLFIIGVVISWKKELAGGIIILVSVLGFNCVEYIAGKGFSGDIELAFLLIPGILVLLLAFLSRKGTVVEN
jgi:hypothetical protein